MKPENLVIDDKGYVRVTDFGVSREVKPSNAEDTSGTPGYMAPEVICKMNHSYPVDFFALGVIAFELMTGKVLSYLIVETICRRESKINSRKNIGEADPIRRNSTFRME